MFKKIFLAKISCLYFLHNTLFFNLDLCFLKENKDLHNKVN
ncbi:hypothetical protein CPK_ORF00672 [Chlamydia pneumoniae LPCoLN]|nr:hypothetical protein CPK_ORF00672 [Chlamydia pneumoniae LPCoLN]